MYAWVDWRGGEKVEFGFAIIYLSQESENLQISN
jgi:hypothetical protein